MDLHLESLPRTILLVRAGEVYPHVVNSKVKEAIAEYIVTNYVPSNVPICVMLDQTQLPDEEAYICTSDWRIVMDAIKKLEVRGAPAIGIAGAAAVALRAAEFCYAMADDHRVDAIDFDRVFVLDDSDFDADIYRTGMEYAAKMIVKTRPTAVNLAWAVDLAIKRMNEKLSDGAGAKEIADDLYELVCRLIEDDERVNRLIGDAGATLLPEHSVVLTHCNAGSLATAFYGTALGVIYSAARAGKINCVYADETRPVCQGARLTAWELSKAGISVTLICDDMAASVMSKGKVDAVIVGADRIAANGDVANKIGTLGLAILADYFNIPFYVAAPSSSIDLSTATGGNIDIEERDPSEVFCHHIDGVDVFNPAFDVTPASLVTKIITEKGIFLPSEISKLEN